MYRESRAFSRLVVLSSYIRRIMYSIVDIRVLARLIINGDDGTREHINVIPKRVLQYHTYSDFVIVQQIFPRRGKAYTRG